MATGGRFNSFAIVAPRETGSSTTGLSSVTCQRNAGLSPVTSGRAESAAKSESVVMSPLWVEKSRPLDHDVDAAPVVEEPENGSFHRNDLSPGSVTVTLLLSPQNFRPEGGNIPWNVKVDVDSTGTCQVDRDMDMSARQSELPED